MVASSRAISSWKLVSLSSTEAGSIPASQPSPGDIGGDLNLPDQGKHVRKEPAVQQNLLIDRPGGGMLGRNPQDVNQIAEAVDHRGDGDLMHRERHGPGGREHPPC